MKDAIANQLEAALAASNEQNFYALIDGALQPAAWSALSRRYKVTSLLPGATDAGQSAAAALPFLALMEAGRSNDLISRTVELACEHSAVTWLRSPLDVATLANRLARRLRGELPDMAVMLRIADARVLPVLCSALEPEQLLPFFAGITGWWYLARDMQLSELALPDPKTNMITPDPFVPPLILTQKQEDMLMEASEVDAVIALIRQHDEQALQKIPKNQHYRFCNEQMRVAVDWNITSPVDQALFCMVALELTPEVLASDAWRRQLQQVQSKKISLIQALEQMTT